MLVVSVPHSLFLAYFILIEYMLHTRLTQRDPEESKESWNAVGNNIADEIRNSPAASWDYGISELIKTTDRCIKVRSV